MESAYQQNNICVGMECKDAVKNFFKNMVKTWGKGNTQSLGQVKDWKGNTSTHSNSMCVYPKLPRESTVYAFKSVVNNVFHVPSGSIEYIRFFLYVKGYTDANIYVLQISENTHYKLL